MATVVAGKNRLIEQIGRASRRKVLARCEPVSLIVGAILSETGRPILHAYFPLTGLLSMGVVLRGRPALAAGLVGCNGMGGASLALDGLAPAITRDVVEIAGTALRISSAALRQELRGNAALLGVIHGYLQAASAQLVRSYACMAFHEVLPRLARCLLSALDVVGGDRLPLSHQALADMLGVQRSAVTLAAGLMRRRRILEYGRSQLRVLDRPALERLACDCRRATK